jgi:long-subunit acyl-CoA synthetase (AMP-forming)
MLVGGSAMPRLLVEAFGPMGVYVQHVWGMTETSPLVTTNAPTPASLAFEGEEMAAQTPQPRLNRGRMTPRIR